MEMLVIALVAVAAFAAVLFPLFRRRPGYGDESEFENVPASAQGEELEDARDAAPRDDAVESDVTSQPPGAISDPAAKPAAKPARDSTTEPATDPATHPAYDPADPAIDPAAGPPRDPATNPATGVTRPATDPVEREVLRYRDAVRSGTVCRKCGQANPVASAYCYECGARLPLADAKEFE